MSFVDRYRALWPVGTLEGRNALLRVANVLLTFEGRKRLAEVLRTPFG